MKAFITYLDQNFFEGDEVNKTAMGVGFAMGATFCLCVLALGLVF